MGDFRNQCYKAKYSCKQLWASLRQLTGFKKPVTCSLALVFVKTLQMGRMSRESESLWAPIKDRNKTYVYDSWKICSTSMILLSLRGRLVSLPFESLGLWPLWPIERHEWWCHVILTLHWKRPCGVHSVLLGCSLLEKLATTQRNLTAQRPLCWRGSVCVLWFRWACGACWWQHPRLPRQWGAETSHASFAFSKTLSHRIHGINKVVNSHHLILGGVVHRRHYWDKPVLPKLIFHKKCHLGSILKLDSHVSPWTFWLNRSGQG